MLMHVERACRSKSGALHDFSGYLDDRETADVIFWVDGRSLHAHRSHLRNRCHTSTPICTSPPAICPIDANPRSSRCFVCRIVLLCSLASEVFRAMLRHPMREAATAEVCIDSYFTHIHTSPPSFSDRVPSLVFGGTLFCVFVS